MEGGVRLLRYGRFAPYLVKQGHEVTWIAADFSHAPKKHVAEPYSKHDHQGVEIYCLPSPGYSKNLSLKRIVHHKIFAQKLNAHLKDRLKQQGKPDLVIVPLPTIANMEVLSDFCLTHNIPYVVDIRDDWPEYFVIKLPKIIRPLAHMLMAPIYRKVKKACHMANGVCGSSLAQLEYGLKMAGRNKDDARDLIFYHGYSADKIPEAELGDARTFWQNQGLDKDGFIISFIGTLGFSVSLDAAIGAVKALRQEGKKIQIVLCGRGGQYDKLKEISKNHPDTVIVPGWVNAAQIQVLMEHSQIGLLPYLPVANMSMPNKIFEYMAGGLVTLSSCGGEGVALFKSCDTGLNYDHKDMKSIMKIIEGLYDNRQKLSQMQGNARAVFDDRFSYDVLYPEMENHLSSIGRGAEK